MEFRIDEICEDGKYVVCVKEYGPNEFNDLTEPFESREQAIEWAKHIKDNYHIYEGE